MELGEKVYLTRDIEGIRAGMRAVVDAKFVSIIDGTVTYTIYIKAFDKELKVAVGDISLYNNPHIGTLFVEGRLTEDFE